MVADVSVLIPSWNRAASLRIAVRSTLDQTLSPREVLVIDDGSTDGTLSKLGAIADSRLRVLSQQQRGVSAARNLGVAAAKGEWIALLDSDDRWLAEKLEVQMAALSEHPETLLCHCDEIWIRNGKRVNPRQIHAKRGGEIFEHCLPRCAISPSSAVLHKSLFESLGGFDETMPACEDYDLWLRICGRYPVLFVEQQLVVKTGGHEDQLSRTIQAQDRYRIRALEKILDSDCLNSDRKQAAIKMLKHKIRVYSKGALKRGRFDEVHALDALAERFNACV